MCGCGCKVNAQAAEQQQTTSSKSQTVTLKITGMTCGGCASHVSTALKKADGVLEQEVKYPGNVATVKYDPNKITEKEIITTIKKAGYVAEAKKEDEVKYNKK